MKQRSKAIIALVAIFAALTYLFAWSPVFEVKSIKVTGLPAGVQPLLIQSVAQITKGDKLARIEPRTVSTRLSTLNWINEVKLKRNWLHGEIDIELTPRIAVGIYRGRALDKSGNIFDLPSGTLAHLPEVTAANPRLGLLAIDLFRNLPGDLRDNLLSLKAIHESSIASIHRNGSGQLKIQWGSVSDVALKVRVFRALIDLPENKEITSIDLSAPHAPIVK